MIYIYLLALLYALLLSSSFSAPLALVANVVTGVAFAWAITRKLPHVPGREVRQFFLPPKNRTVRFLANLRRFTWDFLKDLVLSNIQVAKDVWRPRGAYRPVLVNVPTSGLNQFEIMVLANRITLTPGTLSADISDDKSYIVVHAMYDGGEEQAAGLRKPIELLKEGLELK